IVAILKSISLLTFAAASVLIQSQPAPGGCTASPFTVSIAGAVELKATTAIVHGDASWYCNDRTTTKAASGNSSISQICGGDACKSSNPVDLAKSSLSRPDAITPAYAEGPPGHKIPGCGALSKTPKWTLGTIIFINETGDGSSAIQTQSIQFQVTNEATVHVVGCLNYFLTDAGENPRLRINCSGRTDRKSRYNT
ncbi:hypothetical protein NEUTE2DRAFT_61202, partial [Neurospora tetrasperma FGSC 2509]